MKKTNLKRLLIYIMMFVFVIGIGSTNPVFADDDKKGNNVDQHIIDAFTPEQYGKDFKEGGKNHYYLDSVTERDADLAKKDSLWADIKDKLLGWTDFEGNIMDKFNTILNWMVNMVFRFNIFMTSAMIAIFGFSSEFSIIDRLIDNFATLIPQMTGISSSGTLGSGGLFGNFFKIISLVAVVYALYVFVLKRAFLDSFATLMKTVLVLTVSLLLFSNYSTFLKGAQSLSGEASDFVIASLGNEDSDAADTFWSIFVDRPYLFMQYGTHDSESIGVDRIKSLLVIPPGEDRYEYVLYDEVVGQDNGLMIHNSILDRVAFTPFYLSINTILAIPILLLSLFMIMLQFWFIVIAAIAPFALLIGAIPGFFGVTKRYFIELGIPLVLKIFFSFFIVFMIVITEFIYSVRITDSSGPMNFLDYIAVAVFTFILFVTLFILRKRITSIFTSGSEVVAGLREASGPLNPINAAKKGVQGTATVAGTVAGAYFGGPAGAAMGASIGSTTGRALTGQAGVGEVASAAARGATYTKLNGNRGDKSELVMSDDKKQQISGFMTEKGFDDETANSTIDSFEKNGLHDVTEQELNEQYDKLAEDVKKDGLKDDISDELAHGIKESRATHKLKQQENKLRHDNGLTSTSENAAQFLHEKGANHAVADVVSNLESNGLNDVSREEMEAQFSRMEHDYNNGQLKGDFATEFSQGIVSQRQQSDINKKNDEVFKKLDIPNEFSNQPVNESSMDTNSFNNQQMGNYDLDPNAFHSQPYDDAYMNYNGFDTQQMNNSYMDSPNMDSQQMNNSYMDSPNMDSQQMNNPYTDSPNMDSQQMNNPYTDSPNIDSQQMSNSNMDSPNMDAQQMSSSNMNSPNMDSQQMGGSSMESSNIDGQRIGGSSMESSDMGTQQMGGSNMDSPTMESRSVEKSENQEQANKTESTDRVRGNHGRNVYQETQDNWNNRNVVDNENNSEGDN